MASNLFIHASGPCITCRSQPGPRTAIPQLATARNVEVQPRFTFRRRSAAADAPNIINFEHVDPSDPELQKQIDAILKELDPDFLLVCCLSTASLSISSTPDQMFHMFAVDNSSALDLIRSYCSLP